MLVEYLAVIADQLHRVVGPFLVEVQRLAHPGCRAKHALDIGRVALRHLVDILLRDALLLGLHHRVDDPVDDVVPLLVAVPHDRRQRLLRNAIGQDDIVFGIGRAPDALRRQGRAVTGHHIAAAREKRGINLVDLLDDDRLELHLVAAEIVGEVELGRRAGLHADRRAVQLLRSFHVELLRYHETLAVIEHDRAEIESQRRVAQQGPGRVVRQDVDFARLQCRKALLRGQRHIFDLVGIAEHGGRDRAADIDVEPGVFPLIVRLRKSRNAGRHAAANRARLLYLVERRPGRGRNGKAERSRKPGRDCCYCPCSWHWSPPGCRCADQAAPSSLIRATLAQPRRGQQRAPLQASGRARRCCGSRRCSARRPA